MGISKYVLEYPSANQHTAPIRISAMLVCGSPMPRTDGKLKGMYWLFSRTYAIQIH